MSVWGVIPAAGAGSRIQPLAFSKELLPVGTQVVGGTERPRAVSEYLVERMLRGGATRLCFVISPGKSDIMEYFGGEVAYGGRSANACYVVQPRPAGLCDAIFRALPLIAPQDTVLVGLPDTIWFPEDGFTTLGSGLELLLFPVEQPELFDAVEATAEGTVARIWVKSKAAPTRWVWGAFKLDGSILAELHALWQEREREDPYLGTLVNAWLSRGGRARAVPAGERYVDVGTLHGYHEAIQALRAAERADEAGAAAASP